MVRAWQGRARGPAVVRGDRPAIASLRSCPRVAGLLSCILCSAVVLGAQTARQCLDRALGLASRGATAEAIGQLELATALDPNLADAWFNLGALLHRQGRLDEAKAAFQTVLALPGRHDEAHSALGLVLEQVGDHAAAVTALRRAMSENPDLVDARINLAVSLTALRQFDDALAEIDRAIGRKPDSGEAHFRRGRVLERLGRDGEAAKSYRTATHFQPKLADAHYRLGKLAEGASQTTQAIASYDRAAAIEPGNSTYGYALARMLRKVGRLHEAEVQTARVKDLLASRKRKDAAQDANRAGVFLAGRGELEEAAAKFRQAAELDPAYADAPYNLGGVLRKLGRTAEAIDFFRRAVAGRPDFADARAQLAASLEETGRVEEARAEWEAVLKFRPGSVEAHYRVADACAARQDHPCVIRHLAAATELDSRNAEAFFNLGVALAMERRQTQKARAAFERALAIRPDYPEARAALDALAQN